jgi:putative acetyltransferase
MEIRIDDLSGPEIAAFLDEHIQEMRAIAPRPESKHALDLEGLKKSGITFWSVWDGATLVGCGALQQLDETHAEIKSMRTSQSHVRRGVASLVLQCMIDTARDKGYRRLSLETGSDSYGSYFEPARRLYEKFGFRYCGPFSDYKEDPYSVFMTKELR